MAWWLSGRFRALRLEGFRLFQFGFGAVTGYLLFITGIYIAPLQGELLSDATQIHIIILGMFISVYMAN